MNDTIEQLVVDTVAFIGAPLPAVLDASAPVLTRSSEALYLIGLIGGKEVGKSTLINALAGASISQPSSFGAGTERAIAYAHEESVVGLKKLLSIASIEDFEIVPHKLRQLRRQVLVDLPDVDSKYAGHAQLTHRMLRHILFPIWVQSVEKYADQRPQQLLAAVAEGNDPANFLFCLNKADQLKEKDVEELRADYGMRIGKLLKLDAAPRVFVTSGKNPASFDLPKLQALLANDRAEPVVQESTQLAARKKDATLLRWLDDQQIEQHAQARARSLQQAEEMVLARIVNPILEDALPKLNADPGRRIWLGEQALEARLTRWPVVAIIQSLAAPLLLLLRRNVGGAANGHEIDLNGALGGRPERSVHNLILSTFAQLHQSDPAAAAAFSTRRLWDDSVAAAAAADLQQRLEQTAQRQRVAAIQRVAGKTGRIIFAPLRWLLTIGLLLWFPLVQPLLARYLNEELTPNWHDLAKVIVPLLGASYLLHCAIFLVIWFIALWAFLLRQTRRQIARYFHCLNEPDAPPELSLGEQTISWAEQLLDPLREKSDAASELAARITQLKHKS